MYPTKRSISDKLIPTMELTKLVNDDGLVIIGARNAIWNSEDALEFFQEFEEDGIELRSFQEVKLSLSDYKHHLPVEPGTDSTVDPTESVMNEADNSQSTDIISPGGRKDTYWLAVLKRAKYASTNFKPKVSKYT